MKYTAARFAELVSGKVVGRGDVVLTHGTNDTRRVVSSGSLFVALPGSQADGHDYLAAAAQAGAFAALVRRDRLEGLWHLANELTLIAVDDVEEALWRAARAHREAYQGLVIAITGSFGKTTTKNMLGQMLGATLGEGCVTVGNMNNLLGVPLTILALDLEQPFLLVELGTNAFGEIARLTSLVRPELAVVTGVGAAHLEGFGNLEGVLREKASLPLSLGAEQTTFLPSGSALLLADSATWACRRVSVGDREEDRVTVRTRDGVDPVRGTLRVGDREVRVELPVCGQFNLDNAALGLAVVEHLGLDLDKAADALSRFVPGAMRMERRRVGSYEILLDAYNANPESMQAALETLVNVPAPAHVAVLGSMLELGASAAQLHAEVGRYAAGLPLCALVVVGPMAGDYSRGAQAGKASFPVRTVSDPESAARALVEVAGDGACVLLKGSRGAALERVLDYLTDEGEN